MPRHLIAAFICVVALLMVGCAAKNGDSYPKAKEGVHRCQNTHEGVQSITSVSNHHRHGQTTAFIVVCKDGYTVIVDD